MFCTIAETATPDLKPKQKTQDDETPMYKVILLGDNDYEQSHVVTSITKVGLQGLSVTSKKGKVFCHV